MIPDNDWQNWLKTTNDSAESWFGWWSNELEYFEHSSKGARIVTMIRKTRFLMVAIGIYLQLAYKAYFENRDLVIQDTQKDKIATFALAGGILVVFALMVWCGYIASRITKKMTMKQRKLRKIKFILTCFSRLFWHFKN